MRAAVRCGRRWRRRAGAALVAAACGGLAALPGGAPALAPEAGAALDGGPAGGALGGAAAALPAPDVAGFARCAGRTGLDAGLKLALGMEGLARVRAWALAEMGRCADLLGPDAGGYREAVFAHVSALTVPRAHAGPPPRPDLALDTSFAILAGVGPGAGFSARAPFAFPGSSVLSLTEGRALAVEVSGFVASAPGADPLPQAALAVETGRDVAFRPAEGERALLARVSPRLASLAEAAATEVVRARAGRDVLLGDAWSADAAYGRRLALAAGPGGGARGVLSALVRAGAAGGAPGTRAHLVLELAGAGERCRPAAGGRTCTRLRAGAGLGLVRAEGDLTVGQRLRWGGPRRGLALGFEAAAAARAERGGGGAWLRVGAVVGID